MIKTKEQKFVHATNRWYQYVSQDHHKDRDCHWDICFVKRYSYGQPSSENYWFVRQQGYIVDFEDTGDSEEEVINKAVDFIDDYIKNHD